MKKILSKFEKNERTDNSNNSASHQREVSSFIGKVFTVGKTVVTVEDVLAEGLYPRERERNSQRYMFVAYNCGEEEERLVYL